MRTFKLNRFEDISGFSGTGYVAEGMITSYGEVVMRWYGGGFSIYPSIGDMLRIHGHGGKSKVDVITDDGCNIGKEA